MNLPTAPDAYNREDQEVMRREIRQADRQSLKSNKDVVFATAKVTFRENKCILTSNNGTEYYLTVSDAGVLGTTAV